MEFINSIISFLSGPLNDFAWMYTFLPCAILGGFYLTIRNGGAIDGMEVMAVIFSKKLNVTVGTFMMVYNVILYVICGLIRDSWILPLYSIVTYAAGLKTVDFVVEGLDRSKSVMIITNKAELISAALMEEFKCGTTMMNGTGGYSNAEKTIIYFVVNRFQIYKMRSIVHAIDPKAFVTISEVADVFSSND